jgi:hypothetical protein
MTEQDISQRLSKLERQNRTMKILLFLMFCVGVFVVAKPADKIPDVIKAKSIHVVDDEGKTRVLLTADKNGERMFVYNKDGKNTVFIGNTEKGGAITISNKTQDEIVQIHADEYGNGVVGAYNRKGKGRTLTPNP